MNKSSCQASHGTSTSHGSMGITRYASSTVAVTFTQSGARRNCSRYGRATSLNRSLKVLPDLLIFLLLKLKEPGLF